jgi:beta-lactamase regulating signal transducer with metallopeptidase domain
MTAFLYSFSHVLTQAIVQSLLSSLAVWLVLLLALRILRHTASNVRYRLCLLALAACFIFFLLPFEALYAHTSIVTVYTSPRKAPVDLSLPAIASNAVRQPRNQLLDILAGRSELIFLLYALGVLWFSARFLFAYVRSQQLKQQVSPADDNWQRSLHTSAQKLGIGRRIVIGFSEKINTPCVVGYAKATILIPLSLATSLSPQQAEAVLLHELAHLKYADHYVNIVVQFIRCLLFFNPFVWLIVRSCNLYRELACDELAAKHGNNISLAESLVLIARHQNNIPAVAIGLGQNKHRLLFRIQNLLNMNYQTTATNRFSAGITALLLTLGLVLFTGSRSLSQNKNALHDQLAAIAQQMYDDGNRNFILIEALNDGILQERRAYNFTYIAGQILVDGKELPAGLKEKYEARFKNFLLAQKNNGNGFYSFRSDGLKMEDVLNVQSTIRKNPAPAESFARIDGRTFSDHVVHAMYRDGLLDTVKYFIEYKKDGVFVNHKKLEGAMGEKYWKMMAEGEGYIPKTDKDITTIQNDPDLVPHIFIDAKGNQRVAYDKKTEAQKKDEAERKMKQATGERKNEPARQDR